MSLESNKSLMRAFYDEVWGKGNYDFTKKVFAPEYARHDLRPGNPGGGPEGQAQVAKDFRTAFPDLVITVDLVIGEGEMVAVRWTMHGTFTGQWASMAPTNKEATFAGVNIVRFAQGKVVEIWNHRDDLGLLQQVGAPVYAGSNR